MIRGAAVVVAVAALSTVARADDKKRAAEHFALAQSAEKRKDWRAAIEEYERAYQLSPHSSVLYNIGLNHERLAAWRDAARYFLRYLDAATHAADREEVLGRVRGLREKRSSVTVTTRPDGAAVLVDGVQRGRAPAILALVGGTTYRIAASHPGLSPRVQEVTPEYGEPVTLSIDLESGEEPVAVSSGEQPPASAPAPLPLAGASAGVESKGGGHKLVSSGGFGYHSNDQGARLTFSVGYRTPGNLFEIGLLTGLFGSMQAVGLEARIYFTSTLLRPYVRGAGLYGWHEFQSTATALEAGGGLLLSTSPGGIYQVRGVGLDYFLEVTGHRRRVDEQPDIFGDLPGDQDASSVAIVLGLGARLGR